MDTVNYAYKLAYDVNQAGVDASGFLTFGMGIAVMVVLYAALRYEGPVPKLFFVIWTILWLGIGIPSAWNVYHKQQMCRDTLAAGTYAVVEGKVENFKPMPKTGHSQESFTVNGVRFLYSDYDVSQGGFNNTASHGGPIRSGLPVRIAYQNGRILRLEVGE